MQLAGERLNNRVVKVKRQVAAAKALRSDVTDQLSAVQRLLTEALGVVDQPTPAEQAQQAEDQVQPETEEMAAPPGEASSPGPVRRSGGPAVPTQQEQTRPIVRPQQTDQPTARFVIPSTSPRATTRSFSPRVNDLRDQGRSGRVD